MGLSSGFPNSLQPLNFKDLVLNALVLGLGTPVALAGLANLSNTPCII